MINYTKRLDSALRQAAKAHDGHYRKDTNIPYIIHPVGVMMVASNITVDEDILIACLMHDVIEDVDSSLYSEADIRKDFGERVVAIVKDVTKDESETDWLERSRSYLDHLENNACDEAVIVSASDKIHNLLSILSDHDTFGDDIWRRFSTKNSADQLWWYESILRIVIVRKAPDGLVKGLTELVDKLRKRVITN